MKLRRQLELMFNSRIQPALQTLQKRPRIAISFLFITALTLSYQACGPSNSNQNLKTSASASASSPTTTGVLGAVDGILIENSQAYVTGYACNSGSTTPISVGVYIDGQAGIGTYIGQIEANRTSEDSILSVCGVSSGSFRFKYPIPPSVIASNAGSTIYVHGFLSSGVDSLLQGSGQFVVPTTAAVTPTPTPSPSPSPTPSPTTTPAPAPAPAPAPTPSIVPDITGTIDGVQKENGRAYVTGWACAKTVASSVNVHIYLKGPAGAGMYLGATTANVASEAQVASACSVGGGSYRFKFELTNQTISVFGGSSIFAHGISPVGLSNLLLNNSGAFAVPLPERTFPIYRWVIAWGSHHYYSAEAGDFAESAFKSEGTQFFMFDSTASLTRAIYRCQSPGGTLFSTDPNCEGQINQGIIGYVKTQETPNATRALVRCSNRDADHLATVNAAECTGNAYTIESTLGYVP